MKRHQGYTTSEEKGAKCTKCGSWVPSNDEAAIILPGRIGKSGGHESNARAIHGLLCMNCYESL